MDDKIKEEIILYLCEDYRDLTYNGLKHEFENFLKRLENLSEEYD